MSAKLFVLSRLGQLYKNVFLLPAVWEKAEPVHPVTGHQ